MPEPDDTYDSAKENTLMSQRQNRALRVLTVTLTCAGVTALTGCTIGTHSSGGEQLTFVSYGKGAYQDSQETAWLKPFQDINGVTVNIDGPSDNAKLQAMVEAGKVSWDVMDTDAIMPRQQCGKLLDKIDLGTELKSSFPPKTLSDCGVPDALFALEFMYNTKTYGDHPPTKLADFFDRQRFPGKRVIFAKDPTMGTLESALLADGVAPDQLYPLDVDRALGVYERIRPDVTFAQTYGQQQQVMVDNQADLALVVSARAYSVLKAGGTQWKTVWDKMPVTWDTLVIPKGAPNKDAALKLITFASQPAQSAKFAELAGVGAANTTTKPHLDDLAGQVDALSGSQDHNLVYVDADWWTENFENVVQRWSKWQVG